MTHPLIGITIHPDNDIDGHNLDRLVALIVEGVERAGGLPVLVPLGLPQATLRALYEKLDGLLFSGGGDVAPERYGSESNTLLFGVSDERDRTEAALVEWAVAGAKPLFGICRGAQILNVTLGGTLYRDMSEYAPAIKHAYTGEGETTLRAHEIQVEEETRLAQILGKPVLAVNSIHHQALREVAPRLHITARAPDGLPEAVEVNDHPFGLAVQWHPECLLDEPEMLNLFLALVEAARR
jgi:putative glutamine amidotransferase